MACWDLNGNGIGDDGLSGSVNEDINEDKSYTAADCKGVAGADGVTTQLSNRAPGVEDDVFSIGTIWIDLQRKEAYILVDKAIPALWVKIGSGTYSIGGIGPGGGTVFSVTADGRSGLEAAPVDLGPAVFCSEPTDIAGVDTIEDREILDSHSGSVNTPLIVAACGVDSAAGVAASYEWPNGQTDGFLPNKDELKQVNEQIVLRNTANSSNRNEYWSSTESSDFDSAWYFAPLNTQPSAETRRALLKVLVVRAF